MMPFQLSSGCCEELPLSSEDNNSRWTEAVVQFLSVIKVQKGTTERYRLLISDGVHLIQGVLAEPCNALVEAEDIQVHTVAAIERWTSNIVQQKRLLILLSIRILGNPKEKIGNPEALYEMEEAPVMEPSSDTHIASSEDQKGISTPRQPQYHPLNDDPRGNEVDVRSLSTMPIGDLNPYQNSWTIKARVTQKSDIKTWSKENSEGKLFSVTLMDESGEIKATAFNTAADELFSRLKEGGVYYISKARVKIANKKYSQNDYELTLERSTNIEECHDVHTLPVRTCHFVPLDQLHNLQKDCLCDVIGIVQDVGVLSDVTIRQGDRMVKKRVIMLVDDTKCAVQVTLWAMQAESFNIIRDSVVAFKNVRVGDFGGVSLSVTNSTHLEIEPSNEESTRIRYWYDTQGTGAVFQARALTGAGPSEAFDRASALSLSELKESGLGTAENSDAFSTQATIIHIRGEKLYYPACIGSKCLKKMILEGESWHCDKCGTSTPAPDYRYIMSVAVTDWSDGAWLQGFNEIGLAIFEMTANGLHAIKMEDENKFDEIIHKANCRTFNFTCRARKDTFEDRVRVRYVISRADPIDYHEEAGYMLELLRSPMWGHSTAPNV
ncbi:Replication factor A protein 1 [Leucoagaricus sp. SymC.cos]|nr:Replication factor A protein 1 [Leucoagaricus sp. SymC.cos]